MDTELMCGICLELFDNPLMLPCSHNFCKKCIQGILKSKEQQQYMFGGTTSRYPSSLDCPLCQRKIRLDSGIDSLPLNRTLDNIISIYKDGNQNNSVQFQNLSWNMQSEYDDSLCNMHGAHMSLYCLSCNLGVCKLCSCASDKSSGVSHRCIPITEYYHQSQANISEKLTEIKKKCSPLYDRIQLLEDILTGIDDNEKTITKQLEIECGMLITCVKSRQEELNRQLHNDILKLKRPIDDQLRKNRALYNSVQVCLKKLSVVNDTKDQSHKIKLMQESEKQLNSLLCFDLAWFSSKESPPLDMPTWKLDKSGVDKALSDLNWQIIEVERGKESGSSNKLSESGENIKPGTLEMSKKSGSSSPPNKEEMTKTPAASFNQALTNFTFTSTSTPTSVFTPVQDSTISSYFMGQPTDASAETTTATSTGRQELNTFTTFSTFAMPANTGQSAFSAVTSGIINPVTFGPSVSLSTAPVSVNKPSLTGNFPIPKVSDFVPQPANMPGQPKRRVISKGDEASRRNELNQPIPSSTLEDDNMAVTCIKSSNTSMVSFSVAAAAGPSGTLPAASVTNSASVDSGMASGPITSTSTDINPESIPLEATNMFVSLPPKGRSDTCTSAYTVKAPAIGSGDSDIRNVSSSHVIKPAVVNQSEVLPNISNLSINTRRHSADFARPSTNSLFTGNCNLQPNLSETSSSSKFSRQYVVPKNTNFSINVLPVMASSSSTTTNPNIVIMSSSSTVTKPTISHAITRPSSETIFRNREPVSTSTASDSGSDMEIGTSIPSRSNIPSNIPPSSTSQNFPQISTSDFTTGQAQPRSSSPGKTGRRIIRAKKPKK